MPKIEYAGIKFDSQLEVDYYKYLIDNEEVIRFIYNNEIKHSISINNKNKYTPDFIVEYKDRIEIIETKGYNQFSYQRDNIIHNYMLELEDNYLSEFIFINYGSCGKMPIYRKIKYLKSFGWVDFDFKNPNTLSNKRKEKVLELTAENKELKKELKEFRKYFEYVEVKEPLTKKQEEWFKEFVETRKGEYVNE